MGNGEWEEKTQFQLLISASSFPTPHSPLPTPHSPLPTPYSLHLRISTLCVPSGTLNVAASPAGALPSTLSSTETVIFLPFDGGIRIGARPSFTSITKVIALSLL